MSTAIIGWSGFIGLNLVLQIDSNDLYNSSNIDHIQNKYYKTIYFCGMPAEKWKINQNPIDDCNNTLKIINILKTVKTDCFILISTVDVLDCTFEQTEDTPFYSNHAYGINRKKLEDFVKMQFNTYHILRLPALFGIGLKKNIIFDLINDNQIDKICIDSKFQWYNTNNLASDISKCIENNYKIIHLVSPPISVGDIIIKYFSDKYSQCKGNNAVKYLLKTNYVCSGYWSEKDIIMEQLGSYIDCEKKYKNISVLPIVSNCAWNDNNISDVCKILSKYKINSIEIAPTKIFEWNEWNDFNINKLKERPIKYTSCQSILYGLDINIFNQSELFLEHCKKIIDICYKLGIKTIVFGSPKARDITNVVNGYLEENAIILFRKIGEMCQEFGIVFCIEPNSRKYGCNWLYNISDTVDFINKVNHQNIKLNYDLGNQYMENDLYQFTDISIIGHVQISNEYLLPLTKASDNQLIVYKNNIIDIINKGYSNKISLEMNSTNTIDLIKSIDKFIQLIFNYN